MLKFVLALHKQGQNFHVRGRLCSAHTLNRLRTAMTKVWGVRAAARALLLRATPGGLSFPIRCIGQSWIDPLSDLDRRGLIGSPAAT